MLLRIAAGEPLGTLFLPGVRIASRKHWIAFTAATRGRVRVDEGAARALRGRGRSLLPAGVVGVAGRFGLGDPIACVDPQGREFARGLAAYGAAEIERIKGRGTGEIAQVLGYSNGNEVIHRDDLVLLDEKPGEATSAAEEAAQGPGAGPGPRTDRRMRDGRKGGRP